MKRRSRRLAVVGLTASLLAAGSSVTAPSASATYGACLTGEVCFYPDYNWYSAGSPKWQQQGRIGQWVSFDPNHDAYGADYVRNEYFNNSVLVGATDLSTGLPYGVCMNPRTTAAFPEPNAEMTSGYIVKGIMIRSAPDCSDMP